MRPRNRAQRRHVGGAKLAGDRHAFQSEREVRGELGEHGLGTLAAGHAVDDEPDAMAAFGLTAGDIEDMTEQAAERRAQNVHDLETRRAGGGMRLVFSGAAQQGSGRGRSGEHRRAGAQIPHGANP